MSKLTDAGRADEVSQKAKAPKEQFSVGLFLVDKTRHKLMP